ncbi:MAG: hypothetical protein EPN75_07105 [Beijerinckiaceae bacterium]|nr:MAG: hypothetical protein EPN75_07105 [Beijerinckiaceae bacterium]
MDEEALTDLFARLGARDPEQWARSEILEGIPQLARFLFLRQAWKLIVSEDDRTWIRDHVSTDRNAPGGAISSALARLLAQGASESDLTTVVRVMQWQLLTGLCYLLDDPGNLEQEVSSIAWRLFEVDGNEQPIAVLGGLHESVLDTDPTRRGMQA